MHLEIELEFENAIPIRTNLERVEHGDLLITDMYMPGTDILRMLRGVGLDKQVTIFRSNRGKSSGEVWRTLASHMPGLHVGDNIHSDFNLPQSLGFNCELYSGAAPTARESVIAQLGMPTLAYLVREIRLATSGGSDFFEVAGGLNLPWLFFSAELLRRRHSRTLSFLGRDGQLLYRIYNAYFAPCHYLPFSRKVAFSQPDAAIAYLKAHRPANGLFIDISSTGATREKLDADICIEALIYSDLHFYTRDKPRLPAGFSFVSANSDCGQTNVLLEVFNCGDHGYLKSINLLSEGLMTAEYEPVQLDTRLIDQIHKPARWQRVWPRSTEMNYSASFAGFRLGSFWHYLAGSLRSFATTPT